MASHLRQLIAITLKDNVLTGITAPLVQSVRYRKPIWLPVAKSKEFYVRKPTPRDPEEDDELKIRYSQYRAEVESVRLFLKKHLAKQDVNLTEQQKTDDKADFQWMAAQVKEWNEKVAVARSERQVEEERQEKERLHLLMQKKAQERLQRQIEAEKILQRNKAASKDFITPDKLDEAIEIMLDSRSDYNFAITKTGEILPGEYPDRSEGTGPPRSKIVGNQT